MKFGIDRTKHPHPRRYRRALSLLTAGVIIGLFLTVFGIFIAASGYTGMRAWLVTATVIGPAVIFLAAVGFATYLENLEKERYGGVYHDDEMQPVEGAEPGTRAV